ncbi:MAG TPA: peptidylprolyl isomerase [Gemmatimonadales bacterium]|nr:peptidylprolyl isomerase [Gemmatimonadales bacterium]
MTLPGALRAATTCLLLHGTLAAQDAPLTRADSSLVARVLAAEDRRDAADAALATAVGDSNARVRALARRALGRIRDPKFGGRDSLAPVAPAPVWPEPAWRLRLRALTAKSECDALRPALADSAWPVRLRAAAVAGTRCPGDAQVVATLRGWMEPLPTRVDRRPAGGVSWHAAAQALPALARLEPTTARAALPRFTTHRAWPLRRAAARAAAVLADTATLRALALDRHGNVQEEAVDALAKLSGHGDDATYLSVIKGRNPQAVRAAAAALKGSPRDDAAVQARNEWRRWSARAVDSERDVRVALLEAAGDSADRDRPLNPRPPVPAEAVALALGADVRLRVTIDPSSGGGVFVVRLRGDVAPIMAARIVALVDRKYYDGLTWHRVEHDFVIQGGSPGDNEYVGDTVYLRDELGTLPHPRGSVGMSTRGHDTGDAQWFVNLRDNPRLIGDYTVFAEVVEGIDVVDGVMEGDRIARIERITGRP